MHKKRTHATPSGHPVSKPHAVTSLPEVLPLHAERNGKPTASEDDIRTLAHAKWQAAGCPLGDGSDFWLAAEEELACAGSHDCEQCGREGSAQSRSGYTPGLGQEAAPIPAISGAKHGE